MDPRIPVDEAAVRAVEGERRRQTADDSGLGNLPPHTLPSARDLIGHPVHAISCGAPNLAQAQPCCRLAIACAWDLSGT